MLIIVELRGTHDDSRDSLLRDDQCPTMVWMACATEDGTVENERSRPRGNEPHGHSLSSRYGYALNAELWQCETVSNVNVPYAEADRLPLLYRYACRAEFPLFRRHLDLYTLIAS